MSIEADSPRSYDHEKAFDQDPDEKDIGIAENDVDINHGHLKELEVDVAQVLHEEGEEFDVDSDHSPYPEGLLPQFWLTQDSLIVFNSQGSSARSG